LLLLQAFPSSGVSAPWLWAWLSGSDVACFCICAWHPLSKARGMFLLNLKHALWLSWFYFRNRYNLGSLFDLFWAVSLLQGHTLTHKSSKGFHLASEPSLNQPVLCNFLTPPVGPCAVALLASSSSTAIIAHTFGLLPVMFVLVAPGH
jgi:hypothetical protein